MTLPHVPANRSWYSNWLLIVTLPDARTTNSSLWQVGLIRWKSGDFRLEAFVAVRARQDEFVFRSLGPVGEGPHKVELTADHGNLKYILDGKTIATDSSDRIFGPNKTYLQIGQEVSAAGDYADGTFSAIAITPTGQPPHSLDNGTCRYDDRGVKFEFVAGGGFRAAGSFDPSQGHVQRGQCSSMKAIF
jgi:hypothetical protein